MFEKKPLRRLSICPCGFPVLNEKIQLGTVYEVDPTVKQGGFSYFCGGCKAVQENVVCVNAAQILDPAHPWAPLPWDLFSEAN